MSMFEKICAVSMLACIIIVIWINGTQLNRIEGKIDQAEEQTEETVSYGENIAPGVWKYTDKAPEKPSQGQVYANPNGWTQPPLYTEMFNHNRPMSINVDVYHHNSDEEDDQLAPSTPPAPAAAEYESAEPEGFAGRLQTASLQKYPVMDNELEENERVRGLYEYDRIGPSVPVKDGRMSEQCVPNTLTWPRKVLYTASN